MYLGGATWEADAPLTGSDPMPSGPDLGYHRLASYLLGPGAAEAAVTAFDPGPPGAADLVVGHAMSVLAAGGVERVVGRVPFQSAWRRQTDWHWDPDERAHNLAQLRAAVLKGGSWWLGYSRDRQRLESLVADLHEAAGCRRRVVAVNGAHLVETTSEIETAERLWGPLLDYDPGLLGLFGPGSGDGGLRMGEWVFNAGGLTIGGEHHFAVPGDDLVADLTTGSGRGPRSRRLERPDWSAGL
jgi:hypothetical protein